MMKTFPETDVSLVTDTSLNSECPSYNELILHQSFVRVILHHFLTDVDV